MKHKLPSIDYLIKYIPKVLLVLYPTTIIETLLKKFTKDNTDKGTLYNSKIHKVILRITDPFHLKLRSIQRFYLKMLHFIQGEKQSGVKFYILPIHI